MLIRPWDGRLRTRSIPGKGKEFSLLQSVQTGSGANSVSVQWVSAKVKRPGSEADYSPQFRAEGENEWSYTFTSPFAFITCSGKLPCSLGWCGVYI
jgi:hypothetical protein